MIIIEQNTTSEIAVTLFEKKISETDIYLLEFISNVSQESFFCLSTDLSNTYRYNAFCITELSGSTAIALSGQCNLPLKGQYTYKIYESPDSSLDPTGLNLCEVGRLLVTGEDPITPVYSNSKTHTVYQKSSS